MVTKEISEITIKYIYSIYKSIECTNIMPKDEMSTSAAENRGGRNLLTLNLLKPSLNIYGMKKHKRFRITNKAMK